MSTRGAIARVNGDGFKGVYHHWDSYPDSLGETLKRLHGEYFEGDTDAMLKFLIDDHPAGWSTIIGKDLTRPCGYGSDGAECYCHGSRKGSAQVVDDRNAGGCGCEYVYVFNDKNQMLVLSSYNGDGNKMVGMFGMGNRDAKWKIEEIINLDN